MQRRINDGFIILLPAAVSVRLFGEKLKLSRIAAVPRSHCRRRLILNLLAKQDVGTPSLNNNTDMETAPGSLQFGRAFPFILQAV